MSKLLAAFITAALIPAPVVLAQETTTSTPLAPNTDNCPNSLVPPRPETTSERLRPGQTSPTPLPATGTKNCGISAPESFLVDKKILAAAFMVTDLDSGEIIAQKDPHGRYRPASIIKALIALVAINELDLDRVITASHADAQIEGSAVGIGEGGRYTVRQLLQGLILSSGNDAAHALAMTLGGEEETLAKINQLARDLGTTDTYAASYSGLDAPGMSTSAFDMSLIYQAAFANPVFSDIAGTKKVDFPGFKDHKGFEVWNDNGLVLNDPLGIGGKTGYTDDAHHTFAGAIEKDGRKLLVIILDTTVDSGLRAWQQGQLLLHEALKVPAGTGIGTLKAQERLTATSSPALSSTLALTTAPKQEPETDPKSRNKATPPPESTDYSALGWGVSILIAILVALVAIVSLQFQRRQSGRGSRAGRSQY